MTSNASTPADELRSRIRKYFGVVFALFAGAIALVVVVGLIVKAVSPDPKTAGLVMGITAPVAMLSVVAGSWYAVHKLWRCPACDANVYWLVSWNMSVFASAAKSACPKCGVELFTGTGRKRQTRIFLILVVIAVAFGIAGAMTAGSLGQKQKQKQAQQAPLPPG